MLRFEPCSVCTAGYLSFGPLAQCVVHALKGLAAVVTVAIVGGLITSSACTRAQIYAKLVLFEEMDELLRRQLLEHH